MNSLHIRALLAELKEALRDIPQEDIIVFRYDEDGVPIQVPGHYYGSTNGIIFIEVEEKL